MPRTRKREPIDVTIEPPVKAGRKEITECITKSAIAYFVKKRLSVFREIGLKEWGSRRADILCLALKKRTITLVEVKSGHADFKSDNKFEEYLPFCNVMYFAVHGDIEWLEQYKPRLRELGIGVMYLGRYGSIDIVIPAKRRKMKKKAKYSIITRLAWRCGTYSLRTHCRRYCATSASGIRYMELASRRGKS